MREPIELVNSGEKKKVLGISLSVLISLVLHTLLVVLFIRSYKPVAAVADAPIPRYIELLKQNPDRFVEAPGAPVDEAPIRAPRSDANRKAAMPEPTGDQWTPTPGDGSGLYQPPSSQPRPRAPEQAASSAAQAPRAPEASSDPRTDSPASEAAAEGVVYREPAKTAAASSASGVDWRSAIREVGKVASLGGAEGLDLSGIGGDKGFAEQGPISFETQWYDWGAYAQSMVSRIRVNWYANMPQLIRTGMKGVVTIRFTIQRDGRITDVTILKSSGVPPYDHAAKKAIELSSPLNALPKDFPNASERVTAMFYYNTDIPSR